MTSPLTIDFTDTVVNFTPLAGITEYTFVVTGGGGGGGGVVDSGGGGNGASVTATYSGLTPSDVLTIIVGNGGIPESGGGLTQVMTTNDMASKVFIVAGGGGGSSGNEFTSENGQNAGIPAGTTTQTGDGTTGAAGIGLGTGGGNGGGLNTNGSDSANRGGGGGGPFTNGTASVGGTSNSSSTYLTYNGGGSRGSDGGGGGGGGYGGGGGGGFDVVIKSGGGGGSRAKGTLLNSTPTYIPATVDTLPGGGGGPTLNGQPGRVVITWSSSPTPTPTPTPMPTPTPTPPTPISNICFPAGTPIRTDQGMVTIEKLNKKTHTIQKQPIQHITQTTTLDAYLICFEKNSIKRNMPNKRTIMSKDHQIEYEGHLVPAYRFLKHSKHVKKVKYNGEILYNVLLAKHGIMKVNNLLCETLHPDNIIAKLYNNLPNEAEKNKLMLKMNNALTTNDLPTYKRIVQQLHHS